MSIVLDMVRCGACDEQNPLRARFCLRCGTPFAPVEQAVKQHEVRKVVSVVFCDLTGSTELGERLDPELLRNLLDRYFAAMSDVLSRHGGTVEKFIGDAVVAVFGVPVLHEDDALRAVRAAMEMTEAMRGLTADFNENWGVGPSIRVGVNTGEVLTGDAAGHQRLATGDAVNVAARLEQAALPGQVVIGQDTYRLVRDAVRAEALPAMSLKGKSAPVMGYLLHEVMSSSEGYSRRLDARLVGRDHELATLVSAYESAITTENCRGVLVVGMAGIGKSRLTAEFLGTLGGRATVLTARCLPYGRGITFWPLREMLQAAAGWTEDESPDSARRRLADLLPGEVDAELVAEKVASLLGLSNSPARMEEGFWAVRRLLESLSRWRPVVVVLDDVHWAEPALLDLLVDLLQTQGPILLISGARPEFFDDRPQWEPGFSRLTLAPLSTDDCGVLVEALLGSHGIPAEVRRHVSVAAEGNPLFVEQFLASLREEGVLARSGSEWVLARELTADMVPLSISTLLQARLERLSAAEQVEIELAAVVGRVFWRSAVAELAREAVGTTAGSHLVGLVQRDLIDPDSSDFIGESAFRFRHILVRDVAYAALPKTARAHAHEQFALWLEHAAGDRAEEYDEILGYHLERACQLHSHLGVVGEHERERARAAGRRLAAAGSRAFARGDLPAAINLLERAFASLAVDTPARLQLVPDLAQAMTWCGDVQGATRLLDEATAEADALRDQRLAMHVALAKATVLDISAAEEDLETQAVRVFSRVGDDEGLARAWLQIGLSHFARGRTTDAEAAWTRALPPARRAAPVLAEETAMQLALTTMYGPAHLNTMEARLDELQGLIAGKPYREAVLLRGRALVAAMRSEFRIAYQLLRRSRETFIDLRLEHMAALVSQTQYDVALRDGTLDRLLTELVADDQLLASSGEHWFRSTIAAMLAHAQCAVDDVAEARESISVARDIASDDDVATQALWRTAMAKVLARSGQDDEAARMASEATDLLAGTDWLCMQADAHLDSAEVARIAGRHPDALAAVDEALRLYDRKGDDASVRRARTVRLSLTPA